MDQNKTEDPKVMQLANTLKSHGLAASMYEAIEKARSIINIKLGVDAEQPKDNEAKNDDWDISKENGTLNELMGEIGVTPEQIEAQKKEKLERIEVGIGNITSEIKEAEKNPEKIGQIKEELEKVKAEVDKIAGNETENPQPKNAEGDNTSSEE